MKGLAAFIMRGRWQAMIVAAILALLSLKLPPVSIVSSAAVALVTLRKGAFEGLLVLLISSVAAGVLGFFLLGNYLFALGYGLVLWLPVWAISIVLREGRQLSLAFEIVVLLGIVGVIGFYLFNDEPARVWNAALLQMMAPMLEAPDVPVDDVKRSIAVFAHYMTGVVAAGSVSGLLLGLLLGRWWQAVLYNPGGFRREYLALRIQPALSIASMGIVIVALAGSGNLSEMAWNVTVLLFVLFTFIGTAVLHVVISSWQAKRYMLPLFYILIFMIPHALIPVALIGLGDTWLNLRNKFSNQSSV